MGSGKVRLVGAGPGDPELLTLKAAKALREADVVLHDELVSQEILALIPSRAQLVNVGKRCGQKSARQEDIHRQLIEYALMDLNVVRLKGGDPFIFGRGGEELEALRAAGIEVEVIPGITAALGAAAAVQIPLTHRSDSSTLILVTGSSKHSDHLANWPDRLAGNATIVVYMPGHDLGILEERLLASGVSPSTPCALISGATTASGQVHVTSVANLVIAPRLPAPRLLVIGEVVRFREHQLLKEQFNPAKFLTEYPEVRPNRLESAE